MRTKLIQLLSFLLILLFISCDSDDSSNGNVVLPANNKSVLQLIQSNNSLNQFELYINKYENIIEKLGDTSDYLTVFAFSDEAYDRLNLQLIDSGNFDNLSDEEIEDVILFHIASNYVLKTTDLEPGLEILTESKDELNITRKIVVNDNLNLQGGTNGLEAKFTVRNVKANNGILHIIDQVLLPTELSINPDTTISLPIITLLESESVISDGDTLILNEKFSMLFSAKSGTLPLDKWILYKDGNSVTSGIARDQDEFVLRVTEVSTSSIEQSIVYKLSILDILGNENSTTFTIHIIDPYQIIEIKNIKLGTQVNSSFPNFYNVLQDSVFDLNTANNSGGELVDFFFNYINPSDFSLFSPVDNNANSLYGGAIGNWAKANNTRIAKANTNYSSVTTTQLDNLIVSSTEANTFFSGQVIAFVLDDGTRGLLLVRAVETIYFTGFIRFDMKYLALK